jgi:hypothetical protein
LSIPVELPDNRGRRRMATRDYGQISLKLMDEGLGLSIFQTNWNSPGSCGDIASRENAGRQSARTHYALFAVLSR